MYLFMFLNLRSIYQIKAAVLSMDPNEAVKLLELLLAAWQTRSVFFFLSFFSFFFLLSLRFLLHMRAFCYFPVFCSVTFPFSFTLHVSIFCCNSKWIKFVPGVKLSWIAFAILGSFPR